MQTRMLYLTYMMGVMRMLRKVERTTKMFAVLLLPKAHLITIPLFEIKALHITREDSLIITRDLSIKQELPEQTMKLSGILQIAVR